jgi:hypothetical protein
MRAKFVPAIAFACVIAAALAACAGGSPGSFINDPTPGTNLPEHGRRNYRREPGLSYGVRWFGQRARTDSSSSQSTMSFNLNPTFTITLLSTVATSVTLDASTMYVFCIYQT